MYERTFSRIHNYPHTKAEQQHSQHVPDALLDQADLHVSLNGNLGHMPEAINVGQDLEPLVGAQAQVVTPASAPGANKIQSASSFQIHI